MALGSLGKLFVEIGADTRGLKKGLDGAESQLDAFSGKVKKTGRAIGAGMSKAGKGLSMGVTLPLAAAGAGFMALSGKAANFENQMNEVFTLMPGMSKTAMNAMSDDVLKFSKEMGTLPSETVPALYQAISAGVPKENVFDFMRTANKAAIGGVTDLETAVDGITSVVNAYGSDVIDATKTSDLMFTAVKLGKTNFDELSKSLFNVIPTASALGVGFGDVTAALAGMTAQGTPTSVATTQLRQMLVELSKEGTKTSTAFEDIAGVGFQEFISQGGNVQDALKIVEQAAAENGVALQDMFGSVEAGQAALALTGKGAETFTSNIEAMNTSMGATETAFETMDEGAARSMAKLKAEFSATMIEIGNEFIPILKDDLLPIFRDDLVPILKNYMVPAIKGVAGAFRKLSPGMKKTVLVGAALAAALGPVLMVLGPLITAATSLAPVIAALGTIVSGVALGPLVVVVAAIAAVILAFKHWDEIVEIVSGVLGTAWGIIKNKATDFKNSGKALMTALASGITSGITNAVEAVRTAAEKVMEYFPFSDAKRGPLSNITASGAALMDTFGKGMASASVDLSHTVDHILPQTIMAAPAAAPAAASTSTTNSSSVSMGDVHLSNDFDFMALMKQIDAYQATKRTQRGVV